jgi:parvulin-like peptidyl-prolyl isomerase
VTIIRRAVRTLVRSSVALVAVVAIAVAAGCSTVRPPALTVNGDDISRDSVDSELRAIADNPDLKNQIADTDGTIKSSGSTIWLTHVVMQQVIDREVRRRHIRVTTADRVAGQAQAANFFGTQAFAAFPKWFRDQTTAEFTRQQALFRSIGTPATDADLLAAYNTTIAQLKAQCPSGRFVSHILVRSREEADALANQLRAGASFEQLARQQSTDQGSAPDGGELGCVDGQQLVEPFGSTAKSLPLNQVSAPLQTQFGWHLILVRDTIPFELLEPALRQRLGQQSPDSQRRLNALVARSKVDVDPRYGRWVVRSGRGTVEPPRGAPRQRTSPAPTPPAPTAPAPTAP